MTKNFAMLLTVLCLCSLLAFCQQATPVEEQTSTSDQTRSAAASPAVPGIRGNFLARNINAIDYKSGKSSKVGFRGTDLVPSATGEAKVQAKGGRTAIDAKFDNLAQANTLGLAYLTYVLWAISPQGRPTNLGEVLLHDGRSRVRATTGLQAFAMIVTAEPDFAVTQPSDRVVLENRVLSKTKGTAEPIVARYEVLPRSVYLATNEPIRNQVYGIDSKAPLDLLEARNALRIARDAGAPQYAPASFDQAQQLLSKAENDYRDKESKDSINTAARQAVQTAEEARVMAIKRGQEELQAAQRRAAEREAAQAQLAAAAAAQIAASAQAKAEQEAERNQHTQAALQSAQEAQQQAEQQAQQAQAGAQQTEQELQQSEAARQAALQQQQAAQAEAQRAQLAAQQAEQAKEQMWARLRQQLNEILQTRDTVSGLIVDMPDVLFETGKATLKPGARERLAKVAGIILAYPDLRLKVEGFTDSVGSDEYNLKLSEMRAAAVRDYLISQGVPVNKVVAQGFGKANPIASNETPEGRQRNRRVDLVVSGAVIGMQMGR